MKQPNYVNASEQGVELPSRKKLLMAAGALGLATIIAIGAGTRKAIGVIVERTEREELIAQSFYDRVLSHPELWPGANPNDFRECEEVALKEYDKTTAPYDMVSKGLLFTVRRMGRSKAGLKVLGMELDVSSFSDKRGFISREKKMTECLDEKGYGTKKIRADWVAKSAF